MLVSFMLEARIELLVISPVKTYLSLTIDANKKPINKIEALAFYY